MLADVECGGAVVRLLADSPDLAEAGLDWEEYHAKIEEDLEPSRYSQYAAAFLLTLLPNVETLTLPKCWKPLEATDKLINVVVRKVRLFALSSNLRATKILFKPFACLVSAFQTFENTTLLLFWCSIRLLIVLLTS